MLNVSWVNLIFDWLDDKLICFVSKKLWLINWHHKPNFYLSFFSTCLLLKVLTSISSYHNSQSTYFLFNHQKVLHKIKFTHIEREALNKIEVHHIVPDKVNTSLLKRIIFKHTKSHIKIQEGNDSLVLCLASNPFTVQKHYVYFSYSHMCICNRLRRALCIFRDRIFAH